MGALSTPTTTTANDTHKTYKINGQMQSLPDCTQLPHLAVWIYILVTKYTDITIITTIPVVNISMFNMLPMLIVSTPFQEFCLWLSHLTNFCISYS